MLDLKTLLLVYVLVYYACAYQLALTYRVSRRRFEGVGFFLADYLLQAVGLTLCMFRPAVPPLVTVVLANCLMFIGLVLFNFGAGLFTGRPVRRVPYYLLIALFMGLYAYYTLVDPDVRVRTIVFSLASIPVLLHAAYLFIMHTRGDRCYCLHAGAICSLFLPVFLFRITYAYNGGEVLAYFDSPLEESVMILALLLLSLLLAFSINLMINARLLYETDHAERDQAG